MKVYNSSSVPIGSKMKVGELLVHPVTLSVASVLGRIVMHYKSAVQVGGRLVHLSEKMGNLG
jgi:hypothetical protein